MKSDEHLLQLNGVVVDITYGVEEFPEPGKEACVNDYKIRPGGGYNAMIAAKRSGMRVSYGGPLGSGPLADFVANALENEKIERIRDREISCDQGCCTVIVEPSGERTFITGEGAENFSSDEQLSKIQFQKYDWMLITGYALTNENSQQSYRRLFSSDQSFPNFVFDASPVVNRVSKELIEILMNRVNWISLNQMESTYLTGLDDPFSSASQLEQWKKQEGGVVVRLGANGCVIACNDSVTEIPGFSVDVVDTTGAGDSHVGAFIASLAAGKSAVEAARYANIAAAVSTTIEGPATAPEYQQIMHLLKELES